MRKVEFCISGGRDRLIKGNEEKWPTIRKLKKKNLMVQKLIPDRLHEKNSQII